MINTYLGYLQEGYKDLPVIKINNSSGQLYHGSPKQNLSIIDPNKADKKRVSGHRDHNKIYGSWRIKFAAMFCQIGSFRGSNKNGWTVIRPENPVNYHKPCSIYIIESIWKRPEKFMGPELYSSKPCKVIKEIKFKSLKRCWKKLGVNLVIYKNPNEWNSKL